MTDPMLRWLAAFTVCCIAMTLTMVRFTMALVDDKPSSADRILWGLGYAFSWLGIIYYIHRLPADGGQPNAPDLTWIGVAAISGWSAFHALWLQFWFAIGRSRQRDGLPAPMPHDVERLCARAKVVALVAALALSAALARMVPVAATLGRVFAPERRASSIALLVAAAGFASFMTGGVRLALYSGGARSFTFGELRQAWRRRLWKQDPGWLSALLMLLGVVFVVAGGLSAALIMGDTTTRVVIAAFFLYGAYQAWRARRRRRTV